MQTPFRITFRQVSTLQLIANASSVLILATITSNYTISDTFQE